MRISDKTQEDIEHLLRLYTGQKGVVQNHFDFDPIICPFCGTHYLDKEVYVRPVPCNYCHGEISIAKNLSDKVKNVESVFSELHPNVRKTFAEMFRNTYWGFEFRVRNRHLEKQEKIK